MLAGPITLEFGTLPTTNKVYNLRNPVSKQLDLEFNLDPNKLEHTRVLESSTQQIVLRTGSIM
jgi:hypothetical protein